MQGHCTGTMRLVAYHNAEETRREHHGAWSEPPPARARILLASPGDEREAIVRFLRAAAREDSDRITNRNSAGTWYDVAERVDAIARGIKDEELDPETAVERLRTLARTTGEPLSSRLHGLVKGLRRGKHRPLPVRVAAPPPRVRIESTGIAAGSGEAAAEFEADQEAPEATPLHRRRAPGEP
jgi:hypothetical protein